jgi:nicotinamidase-related amidase
MKPMKSNAALRTAVILVDMQDFFLKHIKPGARKDLIENQSRVIKLCAVRKIPLIVLEYEGVGRGETTSLLQKEIKKASAVVIRKPHNSGFRDTALAELLHSLKTKRIILMGINGSGCVQDTAIGALARGYRIATARGVIASASERDRDLETSKKWFSDKGTFFEDSSGLIKTLE